MNTDVIRRNAVERVLPPSDAWIDRHPYVALAIVAVLLIAAGGF